MIPAPKHIEPIKTGYNFQSVIVCSISIINSTKLLITYLSVNLLNKSSQWLLRFTSVLCNTRQISVCQHKVHTKFTQISHRVHTNIHQLLTYFVPTSYRLRRDLIRYFHTALNFPFPPQHRRAPAFHSPLCFELP